MRTAVRCTVLEVSPQLLALCDCNPVPSSSYPPLSALLPVVWVVLVAVGASEWMMCVSLVDDGIYDAPLLFWQQVAKDCARTRQSHVMVVVFSCSTGCHSFFLSIESGTLAETSWT